METLEGWENLARMHPINRQNSYKQFHMHDSNACTSELGGDEP